MKRVLILILAATTLAAARDRKPKAKPGPYVFSSKASAQTVKDLIVQASLKDGYTLDSDHPLQFRFSRRAQMPLYGAIFMASNACPGMTTKQVWSYTLAELSSQTKVTVQPAWEYPDDYCQAQTNDVTWSQPEEMLAFQAMLDKAAVTAPPASKGGHSAASSGTTVAASATVAHRQDLALTQPPTQPQAAAQDDAGIRMKQHQACLDLAKDNPSITCK
jgi:hypothetical protein